MYKPLENKKILVAVSGGIACYKSIYLVRLLIKQGVDVHVVMTKNAMKFITPLTFQALTANHVWVDEWDSYADNNMAHINLTRGIDAIILAPASANTIAKINHGIADNLLCSTVLARIKSIPILIAPAMNVEMWTSPASIRNISQLKQDGYIILEPQNGEQACGEFGQGRMLEPEAILDDIIYHLTAKNLKNKNIVITAGSTQEYIDPIRYISNASSGKMGLALAKQAYYRGASVTLIYGNIDKSQTGAGLEFLAKIKSIKVISADEMYNQVMNIYQSDNANITKNDIFIGVAAVADWMPQNTSPNKQKKTDNQHKNHIELVKTKDILAAVADINPKPICIGFAAETQNLAEYAKIKLINKKLDLIIANLISDSFAKDTNKVCIISKHNINASEVSIEQIAEMDKASLANIILDKLTVNL